MSILIAIVLLTMPRVLIAGLWLFTQWFEGVFDTALWPILGFLFFPFTLLWYSVVTHYFGGAWGTVQMVILVIAIVMDLSPAISRRKK